MLKTHQIGTLLIRHEMNWTRKTSRLNKRRIDANSTSTLSPESVADDELGEFTFPSASGIEVEELSQEEYEKLLARQG